MKLLWFLQHQLLPHQRLQPQLEANQSASERSVTAQVRGAWPDVISSFVLMFRCYRLVIVLFVGVMFYGFVCFNPFPLVMRIIFSSASFKGVLLGMFSFADDFDYKNLLRISMHMENEIVAFFTHLSCLRTFLEHPHEKFHYRFHNLFISTVNVLKVFIWNIWLKTS